MQTRGDLRHELTRYLRTKRGDAPAQGRVQPGRAWRPGARVNISARPAEAADGAVLGHWEGDLVFGRGMTAIAPLVERCTRYLMLVALPGGHGSEQVVTALAVTVATLPRQLSANTYPEPSTCRPSAKTSSTSSPPNSTAALDKRWISRHHPKH